MIKLNIKIGDEILTGKFKNKKVIVKSITFDEYGNPLINGQQIMKIRIPKLYKEKLKESYDILKDPKLIKGQSKDDLKELIRQSSDYTRYQKAELISGLYGNLDISKYSNPLLAHKQMEQIRLGLQSKVDVTKYNIVNWSHDQMKEIRLGLENKVDITKKAFYNWDKYQMEILRLGMINGVDVDKFAKRSISAKKMEEIYLELLQDKLINKQG